MVSFFDSKTVSNGLRAIRLLMVLFFCGQRRSLSINSWGLWIVDRKETGALSCQRKARTFLESGVIRIIRVPYSCFWVCRFLILSSPLLSSPRFRFFKKRSGKIVYNHCYCTCYARCRYARCTDP